jgi:NAD(P)-dependent dehydrogenase (short-subunit alcohol dehydrogenase family)
VHQLKNSAVDLSGKRVLLTGGAGGLGVPMAAALARLGADVMLTALEEDALRLAVQQCAGSGKFETVAADMREAHAVDQIVSAANDRLGGVDVLINNAGLGPGAIRPDFWNDKIRFWERNINYQHFTQVNFLAPARLAAMLVPEMIAAGWGRIINVTTSLPTMFGRGCSPYGPTKAALEALTGVQAADLAGTGVCANVLIPGGPADTPMVPAEAARDRKLLDRNIMAPVVCWLASTQSDGVTGRRFLAAKWNSALAAEVAAEQASEPVGWAG